MQRILVRCPFHMTCTEISRILCEIHTRLLLQSKHTDHHTHTLMLLLACRLLLRRRRLADIGLACEKLRRSSRASTNAGEMELSLTLSPRVPQVQRLLHWGHHDETSVPIRPQGHPDLSFIFSILPHWEFIWTKKWRINAKQWLEPSTPDYLITYAFTHNREWVLRKTSPSTKKLL